MNNIFNLRNLFVVSAAMVLSSSVGASAAFASDVTRSFGTPIPVAGSDLPVSLTVTLTPPDTTPPNDFYLIDEVLPAGWVVSDPGTGDITQAGHIKWAVLIGATSIVNQYTVTVPVDAIGVNTFSGEFAFGSTPAPLPILGETSVDVQAVPAPTPSLNGVNVTPATATIDPGAALPLTADVIDQNGAPFVGATVTWTSSDTAIADVDATGLVIAGANDGVVTITATATDGVIEVIGTAEITVSTPVQVPVLTSVDVAPATASIETGATVQLTASPLDENSLAFVVATVTWSSSDTAVATVDAAGLVTGVSAGSATITASATDGAVTVTGTSAITVTAVAPPPPPPPADPVLTSVVVSPATTIIATGASQQLSASSLNQNGATFIGATVTWSSSDTAVATVDAAGLVTGVSVGTATVTASATDGTITVTGTATVTVAAPVSGSAVSRSFSNTTPVVGSSVEVSLAVNVLPPNDIAPNDFYIIDEVVPAGWTVTAATNGGDFTSQAGHVKWVVTGGAVSVTHTYTATASAAGIATFSGEFGFGPTAPTVILGVTQVTVQAAPVVPVLSSVSVSPGTISMVTGGSQQLSASPLDQNGSGFTGAAVSWSSSDTAVATVDAAGLVTGVSAGTATVTASAVSGATTVTGTAAVTILSSSVSVVSRSFSATTLGAGSDLTVSLAVNVLPPNDIAPNDFYIIDEVVPAGWTVTAATNGGDFTSQAGHVKWVVTGGAVSVTHTYTATASAAGIATFSGEFGFGPTAPLQILGSTVVTVVPPLSGNQQLPAADVTLSVAQSQVVIVSSYTSPTTISVPADVTNGSLNLSSLLAGSSATLPGSITIVSAVSGGNLRIEFPAGTVLTASGTWSGILNLPTATTTVAVPTPTSGNTVTMTSVVEVGFGDTPITFSAPVKMTFVGQAGKLAGWSQSGVFHEVSAVCDNLATPTLADGADCKIDSGADLVVWTKHFSTFITYAQTPILAPAPAVVSSGGGGGGGGGRTVFASNTTTSATTATVSSNSGQSQGQVLGVATYRFSKSMSVGSQGDEVRALQQFLIDEGYTIPAGATGYYGAQTRAAVVAFQRARGIAQVGIVGPLTRAELNKGRGSLSSGSSSSGRGSGLSATQVSSIITVLQSFGVDEATLARVRSILG